jgi:hypothetical protein
MLLDGWRLREFSIYSGKLRKLNQKGAGILRNTGV